MFVISLLSCKKEDIVYENNTIPPYNEIPTVIVQNYVNRAFIDLIGREPLDTEMSAEVTALEAANLSIEARTTLVNKLIFNSDPLPGDSSYTFAYHIKLYDDLKARFLEGASEDVLSFQYGIFRGQAIADSINGNLSGYELNMAEANRIEALQNARSELMNGEILIDEMVRRMLVNAIYDEINMNSFNFVNATFNDLFFRFPTSAELDAAYQIIEFNQPASLFGSLAQTKPEYVDLLVGSAEFDEGMIIWAYESLVARTPTSNEVFELVVPFSNNYNFIEVQRTLLISDEYAGFD
ncbi:MAG: hypothetical protein O2984_07510 [Bacteroidetes bacterium]|nr:hypothetical protein [Bacteroidota bacterium]